ncbi:MAG: S26 family signal peptidase [Peptococcaceae bacterium]|nr:S26 family signal peptidase [Peptococcaceae bacterium]
MIYRNSYFKKELRQAYSENRTSSGRKLASALFLGLISFALFFVFQTLQESVLSESVPQIMQPSFFSTVTIYIHAAFVFYTLYFIVNYETLFFSEIRNNSWYLLIQMGYHPVMMFFSKLLALLYTAFMIYTVGFLVTVFLTLFLKYTFILSYLPSLYLAGLTDIFLISILSMIFSLFTKTIVNARYWIFFSAVIIVVLKIMLGEYTILSNRVSMQNINNLFALNYTAYIPAALVLMILFCFICLIKSDNLAKYYNYNPPSDTPFIPEGVQVVRIDSSTGKQKILWNKDKKGWRGRVFDTVSTAFLIIFICTALAFNIFIILINTSTPGQEVSIRGVIPFVFQSRTMEPAIQMNDLTFFRKIDPWFPVEAGQIILFEENHLIYVERVLVKAGEELKADIDNYPPLSQPGAMLKTVPREAVHGVYIGRNRWLGALIFFANTIVGRILFLLVPAVLLFYSKQINDYLKKQR